MRDTIRRTSGFCWRSPSGLSITTSWSRRSGSDPPKVGGVRLSPKSRFPRRRCLVCALILSTGFFSRLEAAPTVQDTGDEQPRTSPRNGHPRKMSDRSLIFVTGLGSTMI